MFKKHLLILLFLLVCSCGYTPMTEYKLKSDINIVINEIKGDEEINNIYKKIANSYARNESQKKLFLNIDTNFTKTIISKDLKGNASDYRLTINSVFTTDNKKTISITKDFIVKKFDENFQQQNYENQIKENLANIIYQDLIRQLTILQ